MVNSAQLDVDPLPPIMLFVDADASMVASHSAELESGGLWVATCSEPREALGVVHELRPDLLVTGTFPHLDLDLVGTLKGDPQTRSLPIILLLEQDRQSDPAASQADICLRKPITSEHLLTSSRTLIARSQELRRQGEHIRNKAQTLLAKSADVLKRGAGRSCPVCKHPLEWIERGRLLGVEYDYYQWCAEGCGLYCYECRAATWTKLA